MIALSKSLVGLHNHPAHIVGLTRTLQGLSSLGLGSLAVPQSRTQVSQGGPLVSAGRVLCQRSFRQLSPFPIGLLGFRGKAGSPSGATQIHIGDRGRGANLYSTLEVGNRLAIPTLV